MVIKNGNKGKLTFSFPFDKYNSDREWTVVGDNNIIQLTKLGANVKDIVYIANGLTEVDYNKDIADGITIITIMDESENTTNIPRNKIIEEGTESYRYIGYGLAIPLPSLPVDFDTTALEADIKAVIKEKIGYDVNIEKAELTGVTLVSDIQHKLYMQHLENGITSKTSYKTKYLKMVELFNNSNVVTREALIFAASKSN